MLTLLVGSATAERSTPSTLTASAGPFPLHLAISWTDSLTSCLSGYTPTTECNLRSTSQVRCPRTRLRLPDVRRSDRDCPCVLPQRRVPDLGVSGPPRRQRTRHDFARGRDCESMCARRHRHPECFADVPDRRRNGSIRRRVRQWCRQSDRHGLHRPRLRDRPLGRNDHGSCVGRHRLDAADDPRSSEQDRARPTQRAHGASALPSHRDRRHRPNRERAVQAGFRQPVQGRPPYAVRCAAGDLSGEYRARRLSRDRGS